MPKYNKLQKALIFLLAITIIAGIFPLSEAHAENYDTAKNLADGRTYYFNLSVFTGVAGGSAGTGYINTSGTGAVQKLVENLQVPDNTFTWLPFVYTGSIDAYVLNAKSSGVYLSSSTAAANAVSGRAEALSSAYGGRYSHALFLSEYALTHYTSWDRLHSGTAYGDLIFGTSFVSNETSYIMRTLTGGPANTINDSGGSSSGSNLTSNEWDTLYTKGGGGTIDSDGNAYLKNNILTTSNAAGRRVRTWTQDTLSGKTEARALRGGFYTIRYWMGTDAAYVSWGDGWRPALEVPDTANLTSLELRVEAGTLSNENARLPLNTAWIVYEKNGSIALPAPANYTGEPSLSLGWYTNPDFTGRYYDAGTAYGAGEFDDVVTLYYGGKPGHSAYVNGYPDGHFKPENNLTRAEAATIAARIIHGSIALDESYSSTFLDVVNGLWYADYIGYLQELDVISGETFRPDEDILIAEFAELLSKTAEVMGIGYNPVWPEEVGKISRADAVSAVNILLDRDKVTAESIAGFDYKSFPDVPQTKAYYYDVIEAANDHNYTVVNGIEIWSRIAGWGP